MAAFARISAVPEEENTLLKAIEEEGGRDRLSTAYIFQWLDERIKRDDPAIEVFAQLIKEMIITQHTKVALEKLPFDTFRFYEMKRVSALRQSKMSIVLGGKQGDRLIYNAASMKWSFRLKGEENFVILSVGITPSEFASEPPPLLIPVFHK